MLIEGKDSNIALIWDYLGVGQSPETTDFGIIGLDKQNWEITKGRRLHRLYLTPLEEDLPEERELETQYVVVKDSYDYVRDGIIITSYTRKIEWLDRDGVAIYEKNIGTDSTTGALTRLNKEVRENQMNVLRELGADLGASVYVDALLSFYSTQIEEYIEMGNSALYDAILAETDENILAILNFETPATADMGIPDIRTATLYQITP